jgi:hypothetical protein
MFRAARITPRILSAAIGLSFAAGCSGGGSGPASFTPKAPGAPAGTAPATTASFSVKVELPPGLVLPKLTAKAAKDAARVKRRLTSGPTLGSVVFNATLYPGYAGATPVNATSIVNTSSLPTSATVGFNNVPAGNNEWVIVDVEGYDSANGQGSNYDLGELAGLANVGSPPAYATVGAPSTARLQLALEAMGYGIISTYDLANQTTMDSDLQNVITAAGDTPNTTTGLFTNTQLDALIGTLYADYNRTVTITGSGAGNYIASLVEDYRQPSEQNYLENVTNTYYVLLPEDIPPVAAPFPVVFGSSAVYNDGIYYYYYDYFDFARKRKAGVRRMQSPPHTPGSGTQQPGEIDYDGQEFDATAGSVTLQHVYGGPLIVGMAGFANPSENPQLYETAPYYGGYLGLAGRAPGNSTTENIAVQASSVDMTIKDPQAFAFFYNPYGYYYAQEPANQIYDVDCGYITNSCYDPFGGEVEGQPSGISLFPSGTSGEYNAVLDTWNPFALAASSLEYCTGITCFPEVASGSYTANSPFYDQGNKLAYYNWSPDSSTVTGITYASPGYTVAYSGGTSGYIDSTTPAYFFNGQEVTITGNFPNNTEIYLNAQCSGTTYSATGIMDDGYAEMHMSSIPSVMSCSPIQIGFGLPSGSSTSGSYTFTEF